MAKQATAVLILAWDGDPCHPVATAEALADTLILSEWLATWPAYGPGPGVVRDFLGNLCLWE